MVLRRPMERETLERVRAGNGDAFSSLFHRYKDLVYRTAYLMLGDPYEAEDVLQEVFLRVYRSLHTYRPERGAFSTWLHRITVNQCLKRGRKRRIAFVSLDKFLEQNPEFPAAEPFDPELAGRIQELVLRLRPKLRATVVLRYYWGLSYAEIAATLGIPIGTVKSRLNKALGLLRGWLEGGG